MSDQYLKNLRILQSMIGALYDPVIRPIMPAILPEQGAGNAGKVAIWDDHANHWIWGDYASADAVVLDECTPTTNPEPPSEFKAAEEIMSITRAMC